MSKFYGPIGYAETEETAPGVWTDGYVEHMYFGDIGRQSRQLQTAGVNDNITISQEISILSDEYALEHFASMRYIVLGSVKWKITGVEVKHPRLILTIGGVYNDGN